MKYPMWSGYMECLTNCHINGMSLYVIEVNRNGTENVTIYLSPPAVSQTLVQTSTPTAPPKKRSCTRLSVQRSSSLTASSHVILSCRPSLSWITAFTTCASIMACRWHSVTTWRHMLRPVRASESPSVGETTPSVVSYSNTDGQFKLRL